MGTPFLLAKILIVDDQPSNVLLLEKMLRNEGYKNIRSTTDSQEAIEIYQEFVPDLILLDLKMPHLDGYQVMEQLKRTEHGSNTYIPILVLTQYTDHHYGIRALESGAKDFLIKPFDLVEALTRIRNMIEIKLLHNQLRDQNKILEEKVKIRTKELVDTRYEIIHRLARAAEFRDNETWNHILRMSHYTSILAKAAGMTHEESELIHHASSMHDIGKLGIPDHILLKRGKLTPNEWEIMKTHVEIGAKIVSEGNSEILKLAEQIVLTHHEKWDGTGYPRGLKGEEIPFAGRICAISDVFDALTSDRPYKKAWSVEKSIALIEEERGKHFDPHVVDLFMHHLSEILEIRKKYVDK